VKKNKEKTMNNGGYLTIEEFLVRLEECAGGFEWHLIPGNRRDELWIRTIGGNLCPISSVCQTIHGRSRGAYGDAADLRLPLPDAVHVICAADVNQPSYVRKRMLEIIFGIGVKD
jgi:hypothetical protein